MTSHGQIRELLALSAAGLLEAAEERQVREHVRNCVDCAVELETLGDLAAGLAILPAPAPPSDLMVRTQLRLAADRELQDAQRVAVAAAACAVVLTTTVCVVLQAEFGATVWLAATIIPTIPATVAAILLGSRRASRSLS